MLAPAATARLFYRRYERGDLDFLSELLGDAELMRFIGAGRALDRATIAERLQRHLREEPGYGWFIAIATSDRRPVGHVARVIQNVAGCNEVEIGWCLARRAWGNGYATEAATGLRDYAFASGDQRIIHLIQPGNSRSIAVAERIGSHLESEAVFRGQPVCIYAQTRQRNLTRTI